MKLNVLRSALIAIILAFATSVSAQTGPWTVSFPANPEHNTISQGVAVVTDYSLILTPQGGSALTPFALNKPTPVGGVITVDINAYVNGLPAGTYTGVIRANGPGGQAVSPASSPFSVAVSAPGPQGAPTVIRSSGVPSPLPDLEQR